MEIKETTNSNGDVCFEFFHSDDNRERLKAFNQMIMAEPKVSSDTDDFAKEVYGAKYESVKAAADKSKQTWGQFVEQDMDSCRQLDENIGDIIRKVEYIVDRVNAGMCAADFKCKELHDTPYLVERREAIAISILHQIADAVCCGKGHHLLNWPTFEEMLNEQKRKDNEHGL